MNIIIIFWGIPEARRKLGNGGGIPGRVSEIYFQYRTHCTVFLMFFLLLQCIWL